MEETCRICLQNVSHMVSVHISSQIVKNKTISQAIMDCGSIQISEDDPFSKHICPKCYQKLLLVLDFCELIIKSDTSLRKKLISTKAFSEMGSENSNNYVENDELSNESQDPNDIKYKSNKFSVVDFLEVSHEQVDSSKHDRFKFDHADNNILSKRNQRKSPRVLKNNHKVHEFKCNICNKILFGRSNRLEQHIIMAHSDIKNFDCEICHKKFKIKQQLINHKRVHTGEKPYQCDVCNEYFASTQNLFNHKKKHTGKDKSYQCKECNKGYATPGELETHKRMVHTGEKPFLCEICSRAYSSIRNLKLHIETVHKKTEKCPKCGLMLSNKRIKQHLQKHQDKEDNIRRYTCDKCGKGFFTPDAIKKHQVVHTGERPYICQVCFKTFGQKSAVDTHMKSHSDVRNFSCKLCARTFKYKQHLQLHQNKKHKECNDVITMSNDDFETGSADVNTKEAQC